MDIIYRNLNETRGYCNFYIYVTRGYLFIYFPVYARPIAKDDCDECDMQEQ